MSLKVSYDEEADVLYLAKEGQEEEVVEVYRAVVELVKDWLSRRGASSLYAP